MFKLFNWVFNFTAKMQGKIEWTFIKTAKSHSYLIFQRSIIASFFLSIFLFIVFWGVKIMFGFYFFVIVAVVLMFISTITDVVVNFKCALVSVRQFLKSSALLDFLITLIVYGVSFALKLDKMLTAEIDALLPVFFTGLFNGGVLISLATFGVLWIFFSILANSKVSTMANGIVAAGITILLVVSSSILELLPQGFSFGIPPALIASTELSGYNIIQVVRIVVNLITLPFIIINGVSMLLAQLKGYWVEKYNDGKEITW